MPSKEDYEKFFDEADVDGSGKMTFEEMYKMLQNKGFRGPKSEIEGYFSHCDLSGDGALTKQEYLTAMGQVPPEQAKEAAMRGVFQQFDKSGDGHIDKSEVKGVLAELRSCNEVSEEEAERALAQLDADGDGQADYEEFLKFFFNR